ncbi:MAG: sigma-54-dependent Fis family transcriptional regulator [Calditrichaeota bacterium]|nr:MAG: sigma-54-dependent Fis family transcriptional regulator [Calditrichota bacterium]
MKQQRNILAIQPLTEISDKLLANLQSENISLTIAENKDHYRKTSKDFQLILLSTDITTEQLRELRALYPQALFLNTGTNLVNQNLIFDTLDSRLSDKEFFFKLNRAFTVQKMKFDLLTLRQYVAMNFGFDNMIGDSKQILEVKQTISNASPTDISIFISGPIGSGKSLAANLIHHHSERRQENFITVDCNEFNTDNFEHMIFDPASGYLKQADNGTIYFKEIDALPQPGQEMLSDFIKTSTLMNSDRKINCRIITSSTLHPEKLMESDTANKELIRQISEIVIRIPNLPSRKNDIEQLTTYFLNRISTETKRPIYQITRDALERLLTHNWTENVRELEETVKRAVSLARNDTITEKDILFINTPQTLKNSTSFSIEKSEESKGLLDDGQRTLIIKTLNENDWNYTQTANELGIGRTTLWRKVKKYNLKKEMV